MQDYCTGIRLRDNGRGIQLNKLREKALHSGRWDKEEIERWDNNKTAELIFTSGISTADNLDMTAGRGVGMDGVKHRIMEHHGEIRVHFAAGQYCEFEVTLPAIGKSYFLSFFKSFNKIQLKF
jgi:two-component system chemotaxis sensor kinase CheA